MLVPRVKVQQPHFGPMGCELADEKTGLNQVCQGLSKETARRMAACWNACANIETEALERHALGVLEASRSQSAHEAEMVRVELLAALIEARGAILVDRDSLVACSRRVDGSIDPEDADAIDEYDLLLAQIDAAVERAGGAL